MDKVVKPLHEDKKNMITFYGLYFL